MPLSILYDHLISECEGSLNAWCEGFINNVFPIELKDIPFLSFADWEAGYALCFQGVHHFYLSLDFRQCS